MLTKSLRNYFSLLENELIDSDHISQISTLATNQSIFTHYFEYYIVTRLQEGIKIPQLINIINNTEKIDKLNTLSAIVNIQIVSRIIYKDCGYEYLEQLQKYDLRNERHILKGLAKELGQLDVVNVIEIINKISSNTEINKFLIIIPILELSRNNRFANTFGFFLHEKIKIERDQNILLIALRSSSVSMAQLSYNSYFSGILNLNFDDMPDTIDYLYNKSKAEGYLEFLLVLGKNKNKKDVLRDIMSSNNDILLKRFFTLYGNEPEVKHLITFL